MKGVLTEKAQPFKEGESGLKGQRSLGRDEKASHSCGWILRSLGRDDLCGWILSRTVWQWGENALQSGRRQ